MNFLDYRDALDRERVISPDRAAEIDVEQARVLEVLAELEDQAVAGVVSVDDRIAALLGDGDEMPRKGRK